MPQQPRSLLYVTGARLGGSGLDVSSLEGARASFRAGFLGRVVAYANQQQEIPNRLVRSLALHPVRLLSGLGSASYYGAKKKYADWIGARELRRGAFDFFHGWSGDSLRSLVAACQLGIPSVIDIPTWHRNKGRRKRFFTLAERQDAARTGWQAWKEHLPPSRQRILLEYELATLLFMPSARAAESFLNSGIPAHKLHFVGRGVDLEQFQPGTPPPLFRLVFVGALIERKGIHHLLRVWKKLALKDAELVLVGTPHAEIKPVLDECGGPTVKVTGFVRDVQDQLRQASAFVFPSEMEGAAKATFEAAACGLAQITTRESGDAVVDGVNGRIIPPNDPDALAEAILEFHRHPERLAAMGQAGRERMAREFTWDHFRTRVREGYARAMAARHGS